MLLRRLGSKAKLLPKILPLFPKHDCYLEPFFGTGSVFFNKQVVKYNYLNDLDDNVYNLFQQVVNNKQALYDYIENLPNHKSVWNWLKELQPDNDLIKSVKFVVLSNFGYMGMPDTLVFDLKNTKEILLNNINKTFNFLCKNNNLKFNNCDFRRFFKEISFANQNGKNKSFAYLDPPYLNTGNNYISGFTEQDSIDLFDTVMDAGIRFAMSEFDQPFIIDQALKLKLNIIFLGERGNLKNRRSEILITNYSLNKTLF